MFDAEALLAGDENALAAAVDVLFPELYRYAVGILLNRPDAEDAVQNAFIALWQHRSAVKNPDAVRAYLYRCTYRAAVDLVCRDCGAKLRIPAATDRDLDDLCCHMKLVIPGR